VARMVVRIHTYRVLVRKRGGKRLLERRRRWWKDNIDTDFQDIEWNGVDWVHVAQDGNTWRAPVPVVVNLRVL
jgi:hypothetical protein